LPLSVLPPTFQDINRLLWRSLKAQLVKVAIWGYEQNAALDYTFLAITIFKRTKTDLGEAMTEKTHSDDELRRDKG
jgi:hypothetical protein